MARRALLSLTVSGVLLGAHAGRAADGDPLPCNSLCQSWMQVGSKTPERPPAELPAGPSEPAPLHPDTQDAASVAAPTPPRQPASKPALKRQARTALPRLARGESLAPHHPMPVPAARPVRVGVPDGPPHVQPAAANIVLPLPPDVPPAEFVVVTPAETVAEQPALPSPVRSPSATTERMVASGPAISPRAPVSGEGSAPPPAVVALSTPAPETIAVAAKPPASPEQVKLSGPPPFDVIGALLLQSPVAARTRP
jgi:hypothetical protein